MKKLKIIVVPFYIYIAERRGKGNKENAILYHLFGEDKIYASILSKIANASFLYCI